MHIGAGATFLTEWDASCKTFGIWFGALHSLGQTLGPCQRALTRVGFSLVSNVSLANTLPYSPGLLLSISAHLRDSSTSPPLSRAFSVSLLPLLTSRTSTVSLNLNGFSASSPSLYLPSTASARPRHLSSPRHRQALPSAHSLGPSTQPQVTSRGPVLSLPPAFYPPRRELHAPAPRLRVAILAATLLPATWVTRPRATRRHLGSKTLPAAHDPGAGSRWCVPPSLLSRSWAAKP